MRNTLNMVEGVPTDRCSNFTKTYTEGFPSLYVGDIDISLEEKVTRSTSTSPLEFHEVDTKERKEEEVNPQEPHFLAGSLNICE